MAESQPEYAMEESGPTALPADVLTGPRGKGEDAHAKRLQIQIETREQNQRKFGWKYPYVRWPKPPKKEPKRGRRSQFDEFVAQELIASRSVGLPFGDCARIVGISRRTLMGWMTKGRRTQEEPLYSFQLAMRGAFAKWKRSLLAAATREALAEGGGKLALEMLARIDAQHFGRKDALRVQPVSPEDDVSWPAPPALGEVIEASVDDGSSGSLPAIVEQHAQAFGDHDARELASALALVSKRNGVQNPPGPDLPGPRITIRRTE